MKSQCNSKSLFTEVYYTLGSWLHKKTCIRASQCACVSHLEHLPSDKLMTSLTLNSKMDLVVLLTVGGTIPERKETILNTKW